MKIVVGMSGASGAPYGTRFVTALHEADVECSLVMSRNARYIASVEGELPEGWPGRFVHEIYQDDDLAAPPASGSHLFDAMVIIPCSMSTVGKIAAGIGDTLITRIASVCLKERRKLVVVPRETPLSVINLRALTPLAEAGAIIMPAMPAFYPRPETVADMVDFMAGRVLEVLGLGKGPYQHWNPGVPG